jgi:hypothetical protein
MCKADISLHVLSLRKGSLAQQETMPTQQNRIQWVNMRSPKTVLSFIRIVRLSFEPVRTIKWNATTQLGQKEKYL